MTIASNQCWNWIRGFIWYALSAVS